MLKHLLGLSAALLLAACVQQQACTLIGCINGLSVSFKTPPPASFNLVVKSAGQPDMTLACPGGSAQYTCLPDTVLVNNFTPAQVEITYTAGDKTVTKSFTPAYTESKPNGPNCGPTCKQGKVEIEN